MPESNAFYDRVSAEALGDYRYNKIENRLDPVWRLTGATIERLIKIAQEEYGYSSPKTARDDIYSVRPSDGFEIIDNHNFSNLTLGDIVELTDSEQSVLSMVKSGSRTLTVLQSSNKVLEKGDVLYPLRLTLSRGAGNLVFAVEREGYRYPSSTRFFKFGSLIQIRLSRNSGQNRLAEKHSYGRKVPVCKVGFAIGLSEDGNGFDPERIVPEGRSCPFVIELTEAGGGVYGFNPDYRFDLTSTPDIRQRHEQILQQIFSVCEIEGEEVPKGVGKIVPTGYGVLKVKTRKDGHLWLEIVHKARIASK